MKITKQISILLIVLVISALFSVFVVAEELLKSGQSWDGESITYPEGKAEITSIKLRIEPGQQTPFHCHPIPTFGYVLSGKIEVETKDGNKTIMSEGESAIEVMNTYHRGRAIDGPVEIVVFYAGAQGLPTTVLEGKDEHQYCERE